MERQSNSTSLHAIAARLFEVAPLYATFGSTNDARFGQGRRINAFTFAPIEGDEIGIAHTFFDQSSLRAILETSYEIESIEERRVDEIAGTWAHVTRPLHEASHWFVVATKRRP